MTLTWKKIEEGRYEAVAEAGTYTLSRHSKAHKGFYGIFKNKEERHHFQHKGTLRSGKAAARRHLENLKARADRREPAGEEESPVFLIITREDS